MYPSCFNLCKKLNSAAHYCHSIVFILLLSLFSGIIIPNVVVAENESEIPDSDYIVICEIDSDINAGVAVVVERAIKEAANADAIIFIIDTPGGRVDSAIDITNSILEAPCTTIAYVRGMGAISAGALISFACDYIVMAPGTNIGASTPIMMGAEGPMAVDEKSMSFVRARYRALGEEKGHNPLLGEAMVDAEIAIYGVPLEEGGYTIYKIEGGVPVEAVTARQIRGLAPASDTPGDEEREKDVIDNIFEPFEDQIPVALDDLKDAVRQFAGSGDTNEDSENALLRPVPLPQDLDLPANAELISEPGKLLTMTSLEAQRFGLVEHVLRSEDELIEQFAWGALKRHRVAMRWDEALFAFLTNPIISSLLVLAAMGGIYIEVRTPGFGIPGIIGFTALALLFGAHLVVGMATWVDLLLVLIGVSLIVVELFILPGFGFIGVSGIIMVLAGIYMGLTRVPIPQYSWDYEIMFNAFRTLGYGLSMFFAFMVLSSYFLPKSPLFRRLVLADSQLESMGYIVQTEEDERLVSGLHGIALSNLRPAGIGRFNDKSFDIMTRGEFITKGTPITIIRVEGNRLVVAENKK